MNDNRPHIFARIMQSASRIEPHELKAACFSFLFVFTLMAAYYILRPVRDAMASDWSDSEVSFLWNLNFFVSMGIVALYGYAISRIRFKLLVPAVYAAFALSFLAFYLGVKAIEDRVLVDKSFYLWVSVFSLFHISVFWSYMADLFNKDQAGRLFPFIAAGASTGAIVGPAIPTLFAGAVGADTLMLIAAVMLLLPIPLIRYLDQLKVSDLHNENQQSDARGGRIGGNPFAGFRMFFTNPYLLAIGAFILLYTAIGSFIYFEQKNLLEPFARETRTQILGGVDWATNLCTIVLGMFATGRIVERFGLRFTLALVPFFIAAGMIVVAFAPILTIVLAMQVARRAGEYAVTRPGRETLFTVVDRETRFKAKPVIDVVVYRGGDALSGTAFAALTEGLGLGLGAVAVVGAGIAAAWAGTGHYLGGAFAREQSKPAEGNTQGRVASITRP